MDILASSFIVLLGVSFRESLPVVPRARNLVPLPSRQADRVDQAVRCCEMASLCQAVPGLRGDRVYSC